MSNLWSPAGVFDDLGNELSHFHVMEHIKMLAGDDALKIAEAAHTLRHDPAHQIHQDAVALWNARLKGIWQIARFDAPIEYYAAKEAGVSVNDLLSSHGVSEYQQLPATLRAAADARMKQNHQPVEVSEFYDETFVNTFLNAGIAALWQQAIGNSSAANTSGSAAGANASYNNGQARIGVGDSSTAAAATQTDLQAATNKQFIGMDATFPTTASQSVSFQATFSTSVANFAWNEFVADNCNGSNSTATTRSGGSTLDRVVSAQGTKLSTQTWQPKLTLTIA